jgi:hypothetical protein
MAKRNSPTLNQQPATPRALAPTEPLMLTVKAVVDTKQDSTGQTYESPRMVYDIQDNPIPHDHFVTTPLTATLVLAIKSGDVEEADEGTGDQQSLKQGGMPTEFGGRLTEDKQKDRRERLDRAQQRRQERTGGERQQPQDAAPTRQREGGRPDSSQDRLPERRQEDQQSRG